MDATCASSMAEACSAQRQSARECRVALPCEASRARLHNCGAADSSARGTCSQASAALRPASEQHARNSTLSSRWCARRVLGAPGAQPRPAAKPRAIRRHGPASAAHAPQRRRARRARRDARQRHRRHAVSRRPTEGRVRPAVWHQAEDGESTRAARFREAPRASQLAALPCCRTRHAGRGRQPRAVSPARGSLLTHLALERRTAARAGSATMHGRAQEAMATGNSAGWKGVAGGIAARRSRSASSRAGRHTSAGTGPAAARGLRRAGADGRRLHNTVPPRVRASPDTRGKAAQALSVLQAPSQASGSRTRLVCRCKVHVAAGEVHRRRHGRGRHVPARGGGLAPLAGHGRCALKRRRRGGELVVPRLRNSRKRWRRSKALSRELRSLILRGRANTRAGISESERALRRAASHACSFASSGSR